MRILSFVVLIFSTAPLFAMDYAALREACRRQPDEASCCEASVKALESKGYPPITQGSCPAGLFLNQLKCLGSYHWCELPAPGNVKGVTQDAQSIRLTWDAMGNDVGYRLYAAYDRLPRKFHCENGCKPFYENFVIWDAPRSGSRRFAFYITAVNKDGVASAPSPVVTVDLSAKH